MINSEQLADVFVFYFLLLIILCNFYLVLLVLQYIFCYSWTRFHVVINLFCWEMLFGRREGIRHCGLCPINALVINNLLSLLLLLLLLLLFCLVCRILDFCLFLQTGCLTRRWLKDSAHAKTCELSRHLGLGFGEAVQSACSNLELNFRKIDRLTDRWAR